jgi:hypothetical protein
MKTVDQMIATLRGCGEIIRRGDDGMWGFLRGPDGAVYKFIASWGLGWEHVSISSKPKHPCPSWVVMCFAKDVFWHDAETVMQYHPARSDYVNFHPTCLHLWKPIGVEFPKPPTELIGPK